MNNLMPKNNFQITGMYNENENNKEAYEKYFN